MRNRSLALGGALWAACTAWGQGSMAFAPHQTLGEAVKGAPYSAEEQYEQVVTASSGTQTVTVTKGRMLYRDSEGRVRTEREMTPGGKLKVVEILDPVGQYRWVLDTQHKVAHLVLPAPPPPPPKAVETLATPPPPATPPPAQPKVTIEQLDGRILDGVAVVGSRSITVFPDGRTTRGESWYATELKMLVMTKMEYPDQPGQVFRLTNLHVSEPHPALFRVPADYTVVEEREPFVVEYQ